MLRRVPLIAACIVCAITSTAHAGGYFSGQKGARAAGRSGAFTARSDDLSALWFNPAGLSRMGTTVLHVGNRFSHQAHTFRRAPTLDWGNPTRGVPPYVEFSSVSNATPWQAADPLLLVGSNFGLEDWGFAMGVHPPAGAARVKYPVDGGQRYMMVARQAWILYYSLAASWKYRDKVGVGASLQWLHVPRLEYGVVIDANQFGGDANPVSSELDMHATTKGSDPFTFNTILGVWYRPVPFIEIAASGQIIPGQIKTRSKLSLDPLSPEINEEVELTRDGEPANDVSLSLPLPLTARLGLRYLHLRGTRLVFDIELDVDYASWSVVDQFTVRSNGLVAELLAQRLDVGRIEIEKQWRDTVGVHLGSDVNVLPRRLTLRAGAAYESAVAKPSHAHVDFVSGHQLGGSLGASVLAGGFEVAVSYGYTHQLPITVSESDGRVYQEVPGSQCAPPYMDPDLCHPQYLGQPSPTANGGRYKASTHAASLDLMYRF